MSLSPKKNRMTETHQFIKPYPSPSKINPRTPPPPTLTNVASASTACSASVIDRPKFSSLKLNDVRRCNYGGGHGVLGVCSLPTCKKTCWRGSRPWPDHLRHDQELLDLGGKEVKGVTDLHFLMANSKWCSELVRRRSRGRMSHMRKTIT